MKKLLLGLAVMAISTSCTKVEDRIATLDNVGECTGALIEKELLSKEDSLDFTYYVRAKIMARDFILDDQKMYKVILDNYDVDTRYGGGNLRMLTIKDSLATENRILSMRKSFVGVVAGKEYKTDGYAEYLTFKLGGENVSKKIITGIKGKFTAYDKFQEPLEIVTFKVHFDKEVLPGKMVVVDWVVPFNSQNSGEVRLSELPENEVDYTVDITTILFKDGTKITM